MFFFSKTETLKKLMEDVIIEQQNELYFDRYKDNETIFKRFKSGSDMCLNKIYNNEIKPTTSKSKHEPVLI